MLSFYYKYVPTKSTFVSGEGQRQSVIDEPEPIDGRGGAASSDRTRLLTLIKHDDSIDRPGSAPVSAVSRVSAAAVVLALVSPLPLPLSVPLVGTRSLPLPPVDSMAGSPLVFVFLGGDFVSAAIPVSLPVPLSVPFPV